MKKPINIILSVFILTILGGLIYTLYLIKTIDESSTITIPFTFITVTGLSLLFECVVFTIIYYRHLSLIWTILLPVFIVTSLIPIYFIHGWYSARPDKIPKAGQLPVSINQYQSDSKLIIENCFKKEIDSNNVDIYQDTIKSVQIDTIFYSLDKTNFFAIIIAIAKDGKKQKYCSNYLVGRWSRNSWKLGTPKGNIWNTCFSSKRIFKNEIRQYYYKKYSINNSSDRPEIWTDNYIFNL